jgi:Cu-processing system ATP-binding protein
MEGGIQMTAAISLENVAKHYGALAAVQGVTLELGEGQSVALVGHNGAGKTTLFKLMLGLTRSSHGRVRVLGADPLGADGRRVRLAIGYLPENVVFSNALTGLETLQFYASLKRQPRAECMALLERVGLGHAARKRVATYSKGMRQRLGLAQAVLGAPRLLFLDEPTTGLDPLVRQSFYQLVGDLRDRGVTALLSSHALSELEARIDQVVIMHRGKIVAAGSLDALRNLAGLPVRFRLTVAENFRAEAIYALAPLATSTTSSDGAIELTCGGGRKMEALRRIAGIPQILDVSVAEPTLDEIYASFLRGKDGAP